MTTDIRAALDAAEQHAAAEVWAGHPLAIILAALIKQTRDFLAAEPVGEGPSDEAAELSRWLAFEAQNALAAGRHFPASMLTGASELLARWGRPAAPPAPEVGDVGELVDALKVIDKMQQEWVLLSNDDDGTASPSLSMPISLRRFLVLRDALSRAATLLQQQAAPAPVAVPVAVGERLPGEGETVRKGDDDWAWGQERSLLTGQPAPRWRLMRVSCLAEEAVNWLPSHAIPLPQAGEVEVECLPDFPRYVRKRDGEWQGADHQNGPWRPIPAPQSGLPWKTDGPAVLESREPASVAADAKPLSPAAQAVETAVLQVASVPGLERRRIVAAAAFRALVSGLGTRTKGGAIILNGDAVLDLAAELEGG